MSTVNRFFEDSKKVYDLFQDDKSKDIFLNRFLYNISCDHKYINNIVKNNFDGYSDIFFSLDSNLNKSFQALKKSGKKIVIYGAGFWGSAVYVAAHKYVDCFCDRDNKPPIEINGEKVSVISPNELIANKNEYVVIIGTIDFYDEVKEFLFHNDIKIFEIDILAIIREPLKNLYFERDLITFTDNEVFVDGGCFDFESSKAFLEKCKSIKKIYAFEPNPTQYLICVENSKHIDFAKISPYGLWNENAELTFDSTGKEAACITQETQPDSITIKTIKLDEILNGQKVTFIKLDVEGAELNALKGAKETIIAHRPKLAVCVYHNPEDIIEIPLYIQSLVPEYKFFMRHYGNIDTETVLYCIF